MTALLIYEFRRIVKHPLPYGILLTLLIGMILAWNSLDSEAAKKLRSELDPVVGMQGVVEGDSQLQNFKEAMTQLSTSEAMKMRYRNEINLIEEGYTRSLGELIESRYFNLDSIGVTPQNEAKLNELVELLAVAGEENAKNRNVPYLENANDFTGFTYRLFQFTQSGLLILSALLLGLTFSQVPRGPVLRKVGTSDIFLARGVALTLTGCLILILPKLIVSWLVLTDKGPGYPGLLLPFNPKADMTLYLVDRMDGLVGFHRLLPFKAVSATSLMTLARGFVYMYLYEAAQIFVWVSVGLLAAVMTRRKFLSLAVPAMVFLFFKVSYPVLSRFGAAGFLFPVYQDAIRDVIGSPVMALGITPPVPVAQDYILALSVMVLTGLSAVYLADRWEKRRLFETNKWGDPDEAI